MREITILESSAKEILIFSFIQGLGRLAIAILQWCFFGPDHLVSLRIDHAHTGIRLTDHELYFISADHIICICLTDIRHDAFILRNRLNQHLGHIIITGRFWFFHKFSFRFDIQAEYRITDKGDLDLFSGIRSRDIDHIVTDLDIIHAFDRSQSGYAISRSVFLRTREY